MNRWHRIAVICGAAPLLLGTGLCLIWLLFRRDWVLLAGVVGLYLGAAVCVVGVASLIRFWWVAWRTPSVPRRRVWIHTAACAALLFANVPVGAGLISLVITIATRYTVVVRNASPDPLDGVLVSGGGCYAAYGSLLPGATATRAFWIRHDGALTFRASSGAGSIERQIDAYVTVNGGGHLTVTVERGPTVVVVRRPAGPMPWRDRLREAFFWIDRSPCVG